MKIISNWFLLIALLLAVPVAYADGATTAALQGSSGESNGSSSPSYGLMTGRSWTPSATTLGFDNFPNAKQPGQSSQVSLQNYEEATSRSTQFASQTHSNWIAAGAHAREFVAVPEPSLLLMLAAGLAAVWFFTRRNVAILL